ncbi:archaeosortase/exosortase family protein [Methylomonas koyamae]|nr:archaeosortase/exosortase family protein [Methylomonas koyamae]
MNTENTRAAVIWSFWGAAFLLLCLVFRDSLAEMVGTWIGLEEYSHGFFIPCITVYLIWMRRSELSLAPSFKESVPGLVIIVIGLLVFILGGLATIKTMEQYAFLVVLTGMFACAFG